MCQASATGPESFHDRPYVLSSSSCYLLHCSTLATVTYRVLRLLAAAFDVPDGIWHRRIERFNEDMKTLLNNVFEMPKADSAANQSDRPDQGNMD